MKSFAATASTLPALSDHNAELAGDVVTSVFVNYQWRRIVSEVLQSYADFIIRSLPDAEVDDFRNKFQSLIDDLYTVESMDGTPVGSIVAFPDDAPPSEKWLYLNGQSVLQADYPDLYALIGNFFTVPPSATHFNLPDMRERFIRGATNSLVIFASGGEDEHTLTLAEMPNHTHDIFKGTAVGTNAIRVAGGNATALANSDTGTRGGGGAHNNLPRYMMFAWMIKALP